MAKLKRKDWTMKLERQKQKALQLRKDSLRKDMAQWLADFTMCTCSNQRDFMMDLMHRGHKGYLAMKSKELIKLFEDAQVKLNDKKQKIGFWHQPAYSYSLTTHAKKMNEKSSVELHDEFIAGADALTCRLMELAFNLDEE